MDITQADKFWVWFNKIDVVDTFTLLLLQLHCPNGISPIGNRVVLPGESQLRQSRATQPTYGACWVFKCFHNPPNSDMDYRIFNVHMEANACGCTRDTVRESALKVDSGRNIPCRTGESNLRQRRAGPMFYQMSYIPARRTKDLPHRTETSSISLRSRGHRFCFYFVLKLIYSASCEFCLLLFTISLNSETHSQPVACATVFLHTH